MAVQDADGTAGEATSPPRSERAPLFQNVPDDVVEELTASLDRRRFTAGTTIIAEGDLLGELYIARSGTAEVFVADRHGVDHRIGRVDPGATLGEVSLFTGAPATATIRATSDCEVLVLPQADFDRLAEQHPVVYRNLGALLSQRLARASRLAVHGDAAHLFVLRDRGAPPLLGAALAASLAWHANAPTLLLVLDDADPELRALAAQGAPRGPGARGDPRADIVLADGAPEYVGDSLRGALEEHFLRYEHVLVQARSEIVPLATAREIELRGEAGDVPEGVLTLVAWRPAAARLGPDPGGAIPIPAFTAGDRDDLMSGRLAPGSDAGRALGWVARDLADLKVGLALGAGSMRGYAHVGVLRVIERAGIPVDYIAGTSVGSAVAAMYAMGRSPDEIADTLDGCGATMFRPTLPLSSLLSSRAMTAFIRGAGSGRRLEDLELPCAVVAADIEARREVVLRRGDVALAVVASISIPGIYPVQRLGPYSLVDGGVINPVPASVVAEMGAGQVIAVKLGAPGTSADLQAAAVESSGSRPFIVPVLMRAIEMMQERIATETTAPTVLITPVFKDLADAKLRRFREGRRYIQSGEEAAEAALPRLAAMLPWVKG